MSANESGDARMQSRLLCLLALSANVDVDAWRERMLNATAPRIIAIAGKELRMAFADSGAAPATGLRREAMPPLPCALVSLGLDQGDDTAATRVIALLRESAAHVAAYLTEQLEFLRPPARAGARTAGSMQFCSFKRRADITEAEFLRIWREDHSIVASETQSTFGYRQHRIVGRLSPECTGIDAIVEEHFPAAAMSDPRAFFAAGNDKALLNSNIERMMQSCARFIDTGSINVIHMSEYTPC